MKQIEKLLKKNNSKGALFETLFICYMAVKIVLHSRLKLFAAALSYTTLLAAVPLLAVLFSLLRSFGIDDVIKEAIDSFLAPLGDSGAEVSKYLFEFIQNAQTGLLGGIGLAFLFYSIFTLIQKVELALNNIWNVSKPRTILAKITGYFSSLMLIVVFAAFIVWINIFLHKIESENILVTTPALGVLFSYLAKMISFLIVVLLLAILYSVIPNTKVRFKSAFIGGAACAICWIPMTKFFSLMIGSSENYSVIYTSFASIVVLLIWLNIVWLLFLSGALVSYFVQYPNVLKQANVGYLNPAEQVYYSQKIIHLCIDYFKQSRGKVSLKELLEETKISHKQMLDLLKPFLRDKILIKTDEYESFYLLAVDPSLLTDDFVQKIVYGEVRRLAPTKSSEAKYIDLQ